MRVRLLMALGILVLLGMSGLSRVTIADAGDLGRETGLLAGPAVFQPSVAPAPPPTATPRHAPMPTGTPEPVEEEIVEEDLVDLDPYEADPYEAETVEVDPYEVDPYEVDPYEVDPYEAESGEVETVAPAAPGAAAPPLAAPRSVAPPRDLSVMPSLDSIPRGVRWAYVSLSSQRITAMVGDTPVYVALATTGKPGFATPRGTFTIVRRVYNETMDSLSIGLPRNSPEGYYIRDILFTQYFDWQGDAIHLNYWQPASVFGRVPTSHGCVGLQYADAEFFWYFLSLGSQVVIGN